MNRNRGRIVGVTLGVTALAVTLLVGASPASAVPTAILRILVTGPAGELAPGVYVTGTGFAGYTDDDGVFVTPVDPATATQVCGTLDPDSPLGGAAGWAKTCRPVDVTPGTTTRVRVVMQPGAALSGRVTDARTGQPLPDAELFYSADDSGRVVLADADGVWTFRNLTPSARDRRDVSVVEPYLVPYPSPARWGYVTTNLTARLPLRAGAVTSGLDTALVPIVRVRGTVTDDAGQPVAGAAVTVRLDADTVDDTTTNGDGDYLLLVPWDSNGPVCAGVAPNAVHPHGLARQCVPGLLRHRIEARADFHLEEGTG